MRRYLALLPLLLCSCKPPEDSHMKVIIGAVMLDGNGGPPLSNSVVVTSGAEIREAGSSSNVPIPAEADKIDGSGRFLVPGFVDVSPQTKASVVFLKQSAPVEIQSAMEAARDAGTPVIGRASTQAEMQFLVAQGAAGIIGMIRDTENPDAALLARMRDLHVVVAPALCTLSAGPELERAQRNTRRLFDAGVPLGVASNGGDFLREAEALSAAGVPPLDVIVAATRHGAMALHLAEREGTIQPGHRADMILLSANPGEDVRNLRRVAGRLVAGEWQAK